VKSLGSNGDDSVFRFPFKVCVLEDDSLAVADEDTIKVVSLDGASVQTIFPHDDLSEPLFTDISLLEDGTLVLANAGSEMLQVITPDGSFLREFPCPSGSGCGMILPLRDNDLAFVPYGGDSVTLFTQAGTPLREFGSAGRGDGQFVELCAAVLLEDDRLLLADSDTDRLQLMNQNGESVRVAHIPHNHPCCSCAIAVLNETHVAVALPGQLRIVALRTLFGEDFEH